MKYLDLTGLTYFYNAIKLKFAAFSHTHDADDVDQGVLNIGRIPTVNVSHGGTGRTSFLANRLIYPASTDTIDQLSFPTVSGSVLRQGISGAPYWTSTADYANTLYQYLFDIYRLALTSDITTSATTTKLTLSNVTKTGTSSVFSTSSNGIKVSTAGKYLVSAQLYHSLKASNHSGTLAIALNGTSTYILKSNSRTYGTTTGNDTINLPPTLVDLAANDVIYLYYAGTSGDVIGGATATTGTKYGTYLQLQRVA